ncbi:hypothetical protein C8R44DRAFT_749959 [Mycena epipterygia]|nr:hypothetical protein C8R44DRAFT_749959 [Mycena epipterygia]
MGCGKASRWRRGLWRCWGRDGGVAQHGRNNLSQPSTNIGQLPLDRPGRALSANLGRPQPTSIKSAEGPSNLTTFGSTAYGLDFQAPLMTNNPHAVSHNSFLPPPSLPAHPVYPPHPRRCPAVEELGQAQRALTPGISRAVLPRPVSVRVKISGNARSKDLYNILI